MKAIKKPIANKVKNNNISPKSRRKIMSFDFYKDIKSYQEKPISVAAIEKLSEDLIEWAMNDMDALKIKPFLRARGIGSNDVKRWRKKFPKFDRAYAETLEAIGDRREIGAIKKLYDCAFIARSMVHYDKQWKESEEWRANLKNQEQENKPTTFIIQMPDFSKKVEEK